MIPQRSTAMHCLKLSLVLSHLLLTTIGAIELTCDTVNPSVQSDVTCICKRTSGTGVDWFIDDTFHSNCLLNSICVPQYPGYSYTINSTENVYEITINSYSYNDCKKVSCKDATDSTIELSVVPSSIIFDTTYPTSLTEPASNNSNGVISVTTGCISGFSDVEYQWYIIVDNSEEKYTPDQGTVINTTDTSTCSNCNTDNNGKRTIGFNHQEASGSGTENVSFRVILYHATTNLRLNLTSNNFYSIKRNHTTSISIPPNITTKTPVDANISTLNISLSTSKQNVISTSISSTSMKQTIINFTTVTSKDNLIIDDNEVLYITLGVLSLISFIVILCYCKRLSRSKIETERHQTDGGEPNNTQL